MMKFDFVYTFHFRENDKDEAIKRLNISLSSLDLNYCKPCLLNCSSFCIKDKINLDINYIHLPTDFGENLYNRSFMVNYCVKNLVKTEYFNISDIDIVYPKTFIETMSNVIEDNKGSSCRILFHNHNMGQGNFNSYEDCHNSYLNCKDILRSKTGPAPGLGIVHTDSFLKINGFDERFVGYGPEDKEFNFRISRICKYIDLDDERVNTYHLWHVNNTPKVNYRNNMRIWIFLKNYIENRNLIEVKSGSIPIPYIIYHQENENIVELEF